MFKIYNFKFKFKNKTKKPGKPINKRDYLRNIITILFLFKFYLLSFKNNNIKIYSIINLNKHPLLISITYNNYITIHLINNRVLLVLNSFIPVTLKEIIKANTTTFLIINKNTRILKDILNKLINLNT